MAYRDNDIFDEYEYFYLANNTVGGLDYKHESEITSLITIPDAKDNTINTPNGLVKFVQFVGVTENEILEIIKDEKAKKQLHLKLKKKL